MNAIQLGAFHGSTVSTTWLGTTLLCSVVNLQNSMVLLGDGKGQAYKDIKKLIVLVYSFIPSLCCSSSREHSDVHGFSPLSSQQPCEEG